MKTLYASICLVMISLSAGTEMNESIAVVLGLPPIAKESVAESPLSKLGKQLFLDPGLSTDGKVSCATCHRPRQTFTDGKVRAQIDGKPPGTRNTPSLLNVIYERSLFWDGRRRTLEEQAGDPFLNSLEHGFASHEDVLSKITARAAYRAQFNQVFSSDRISMSEVSAAIAAYLRTLVSGNSPFDQYFYGGRKDALTTRQKHGMEIFRGSGQCASCHQINPNFALFTDHKFHSVGVGLDRITASLRRLTAKIVNKDSTQLDHLIINDPELAELGRFLVTRNPTDIGKFKTPSLRNVALTAPYMHDGSVATLEEAVEREIYYRGLSSGRPLNLSADDKAALVEFLKALTSK